MLCDAVLCACRKVSGTTWTCSFCRCSSSCAPCSVCRGSSLQLFDQWRMSAVSSNSLTSVLPENDRRCSASGHTFAQTLFLSTVLYLLTAWRISMILNRYVLNGFFLFWWKCLKTFYFSLALMFIILHIFIIKAIMAMNICYSDRVSSGCSGASSIRPSYSHW